MCRPSALCQVTEVKIAIGTPTKNLKKNVGVSQAVEGWGKKYVLDSYVNRPASWSSGQRF
jgi:hypothetical protein